MPNIFPQDLNRYRQTRNRRKRRYGFFGVPSVYEPSVHAFVAIAGSSFFVPNVYGELTGSAEIGADSLTTFLGVSAVISQLAIQGTGATDVEFTATANSSASFAASSLFSLSMGQGADINEILGDSTVDITSAVEWRSTLEILNSSAIETISEANAESSIAVQGDSAAQFTGQAVSVMTDMNGTALMAAQLEAEGEFTTVIQGDSLMSVIPQQTYAQLILTTGTNGVEATVTEGGTYTWSDDLSYWIRKEAFDASSDTRALLAKIDGDAIPADETPAWSGFISDGGTVASDGTNVKWDSMSGSAIATIWTSYDHTLNAQSALWQGMLKVEAVTGTDSYTRCAVHMQIGDNHATNNRVTALNLSKLSSGGDIRLVNSSNTALGTVVSSENLSGSYRFVEILTEYTGSVRVWVDHVAQHALSCSWSDLHTDTFRDTGLGDVNSNSTGNSILLGRDIKFFQLT